MELSIYNVIKRPVVSDKSSQLARLQNKIVVDVHPNANKHTIAQAIEKLFNVKVASVRVIVRKGKVRTFKRIKSKGNLSKRAIVTLKPGYSLSEAGIVSEGRTESEVAKG